MTCINNAEPWQENLALNVLWPPFTQALSTVTISLLCLGPDLRGPGGDPFLTSEHRMTGSDFRLGRGSICNCIKEALKAF